MTSAVAVALRRVDPIAVRSDLGSMRDAVALLATADPEVWTAEWPSLVQDLYDVGRVDLCLARLVEGHADALRILDQAGVQPRHAAVYGVWASRSAGTGLTARRDEQGWRLSGELRFASGVDLIDRVLVPGWVDDDHHLLFDVAVEDFSPDRVGWATRAMDASRSFTCTADRLRAGEPVGPLDFYLHRPGFTIGGLGPAAVWAGGARLLTDLVLAGVRRGPTTSHQERRVGILEQACWLSRMVVDHVAIALSCPASGADGSSAAGEVARARTSVVEACDVVVAEVAQIVGPAVLSRDVRLVHAHQDLSLYVRQQNLDRAHHAAGKAALGREG